MGRWGPSRTWPRHDGASGSPSLFWALRRRSCPFPFSSMGPNFMDHHHYIYIYKIYIYLFIYLRVIFLIMLKIQIFLSRVVTLSLSGILSASNIMDSNFKTFHI